MGRQPLPLLGVGFFTPQPIAGLNETQGPSLITAKGTAF